MSELALKLIRENKETKEKFLDLGNCGITEVPEEIGDLVWLEELSFAKDWLDEVRSANVTKNKGEQNNICCLPQSIDSLRNLQILRLNGNRGNKFEITDLTSITNLENLKSLYIYETNISDLSPIKGLEKLRTLNIYETKVIDISPISNLLQLEDFVATDRPIQEIETLSKLKKLTKIHLRGSNIDSLQPLSNSKKLELLDISNTNISDLSPLKNCINLKHLIASNCSISDLSCLSRLTKLKSLYISNTNVDNLTPILNLLRKNCFISAYDTPLVVPPREFANEGNNAIVEYFDQLKNDSNPLNELKVIFLGEGSSGKTSLIRRIRKEKFNKKEDQTHGIRIRKTPFEIKGETITAHLWDFGGQEVMHATHQFFLSQRCVYVLVLDSRKDEKAEYWLKHAESFGDKSPVLVVLNKIDENPSFDVNRKILLEKYPQIKDFFQLSCESDKGVMEFKEALTEQLALSDARRTPFPATWSAVKNHFVEMSKDYIDSSAYKKVCEKNKVEKQLSQDVLLQFLHDLGIIINFRSLKNFDTQILNPLWLTNGVYRIINSEKVVKNKGVLEEDDFDAVINDPRYKEGNTVEKNFEYPVNKLNYIVRVMQEFELCYRLNDNSYVVPQLLPVKEPEFDFEGAVLHFVVEFPEFLPDSIFPRLMVKLHQFIDDDLRWRTGMVLHKPNVFDAKARVRSDKEDKKISIDICGEERRRFLSFIRETLKEIIDGFTNLSYDEMVPVRDTGEFMEYDYLVEAEKAGEKEVFVRKLKGRIEISELLDGVEESSMRGRVGQTPVKVFISYSHKDLRYLKSLRSALAPLERLKKLEMWDDQAIEAGEDWRKVIYEQLEKADIVLCLISADFVKSDFCFTDEMAKALAARKDGKEVVAIQARKCHWDNLPIAELQALPGRWISSSRKKDELWTDVAKGLEAVVDRAKYLVASKRRRGMD